MIHMVYTNITDKISVVEKRASLSGLTLQSDIATMKMDVGGQH